MMNPLTQTWSPGTCAHCGRPIPPRRMTKGSRVGTTVSYCSRRCQNAAKQARHRDRLPAENQALINLRNLVAHGMIAEKLLHDPVILDIARKNLERWRNENGPSKPMEEWSTLLESGNVRAIILELLRLDEEGMRMRSSSPFTGVLDEHERDLLYRAARR